LVATAQPAARVVVLGAPGGVAPHVLARALVAFAPGLVGYGAVALLSRALYARGDAKTPALATAGGWLLAVVADVALVATLPRDWTAAALGIGTTVGMTAAGGWLAVSLRRGSGPASLAGVRTTAGACLTGAVVAAVVAYVVARALPTTGVAGSVASTALVAGVCVGLYAGVVGLIDRPSLLLLRRRRTLIEPDTSTSS
jgi:putative peptidoglycan lipid II flippase